MSNEVKMGPVPIADGYAGNLTQEQTAKLRQFWAGYFGWAAMATGSGGAPKGSPLVSDDLKAGSQGDAAKEEARIQEEQANLNALLESYGPDSLKRALWEFIKMDNPDSICLRFLRARKWDVTRALGMFAGCLKWRLDNQVQELVEGGDLNNGEKIEKFLDQQRSGKTYSAGSAGGTNVAPIPICYIHVKKHLTNGQPASSMEKYIIYAMESFRCLMQPPGDKAVMFFDLGGFGVKNMDWHCVLFIVKCLEAFYPESLAVLYVHNAPWIFSGIWKVLSPMLDPVVRSKIQFTKNAKDVQANVPADHMVASLGGNNLNEFNFIEPQPGENNKINDTTVKPQLLKRYHDLADAYEAATRRWIETNGQDPSVEEERTLLFKKLRVAQFDVEPYTRGLTVYHRNGVVNGQGVTRWTYRTKEHTKYHVIGRGMCAATLRREIYEIEHGKSCAQAEAESRKAEERRDWVALYGDPHLAASVEGQAEVRNSPGILTGVQYDFTAPPGGAGAAVQQPQAQPQQSRSLAPGDVAHAGVGAAAGSAAYAAADGNSAAYDVYDDHVDAPAAPSSGTGWVPGKYQYLDLGGPSAKEVESKAFDLPEGTAKTLTPDQQVKLREMWAVYFSWLDKASGATSGGGMSKAQAIASDSDPKKAKSDDDKEAQRIAEEQAQLNDLLDTYGGEALKQAAWQFLDFDDPDGSLLRFLRARKWDVSRAMNMCGATIKWRLENDVADLVAKGDLGNSKVIPKFLDQQRENKTFACGTALNEQPICAILVKKHLTNGQPASSMEKFVIFAMESFRLLMQPPQEKVVIIFSLEGFGIKNMDWNCVLFIVKCLEAFYPESLGCVYLYAAPWIFSGIWKVLSPLLDPVVRSKIVFVKSAKDFGDRIPPERLIEEVGGQAVESFKFIEPVEGENNIQLDQAEKQKFLGAYMALADQFEDATRRWIESNGRDPNVIHKRALLKRKLRVAAFDKMPYVRGKTAYHRQGTIDGMGRVTWVYKTKDGQLLRHVIGRRDHYATMLREIQELEQGASVAEVEAKTEAAIKRRDWLALYGDAHAAHEIEGVPLDAASAPAPVAAQPAHKKKHRAGKHHHHGHHGSQAKSNGTNAALAGSVAGGGGYAAAQAYSRPNGNSYAHQDDWTNDMEARSGSQSSVAMRSTGTAPTEHAWTDRSTSPPREKSQPRSQPVVNTKPVLPPAGGYGRYGTHEADDGYTSAEDLFFDTTEAHPDDLARARSYIPPGHNSEGGHEHKHKHQHRSHRDRRSRRSSTRGPGVFADDAAATPVMIRPRERENSMTRQLSSDGRSGRSDGLSGRSGRSDGLSGRSGRSDARSGRSGRSGGSRSIGHRPAPGMVLPPSGASYRNPMPNGGGYGFSSEQDFNPAPTYRYNTQSMGRRASYTGSMRVTGGSSGGSTHGSAAQLYGGSYHYGPGAYGEAQHSEDLALLYPSEETSYQQKSSSRNSVRAGSVRGAAAESIKQRTGSIRRAASSVFLPSRASTSTPQLGTYDDGFTLPQPGLKKKPSLRRRMSAVFTKG